VSKPAGTFIVAAAPLKKNSTVLGDGSPPMLPVPPPSLSMIDSAFRENVIPKLGPGPLPRPPSACSPF
jgi:hypothetical protein